MFHIHQIQEKLEQIQTDMSLKQDRVDQQSFNKEIKQKVQKIQD